MHSQKTVVAFSATLSQGAGSDSRKRTGPVFFPGDFGKKGKYTLADLQNMAVNFSACDLNLEHRASMLDKKLGRWTRAFASRCADGRDALFAEYEMTAPLAELLGNDPLNVSVEIDRIARRFVGMALTSTPHFKDAVLFSSAVEQAYEQPENMSKTIADGIIARRLATATHKYIDRKIENQKAEVKKSLGIQNDN